MDKIIGPEPQEKSSFPLASFTFNQNFVENWFVISN